MAPQAKPVAAWIRSSHPLAQKLVAAWPFQEGTGATIRDCGAMGLRDRDATAQTAPTWTAFSPHGRALNFDGTNQWASVPVGPPSVKSQSLATIEAIVFPTAAADYYVYVEESGGAFSIRMAIRVNAGTWQGIIDETDNQTSSTPTLVGPAPTANAVAHLVLSANIKNGDNFLMINGKVVASNAATQVAMSATASQGISIGGFRGSGAGSGFQGNIALVRVWAGRALTRTEAQQLYSDPFGMFRREHASPVQSGSAAGGVALDAPGKIRHVIPDTFIRTIN